MGWIFWKKDKTREIRDSLKSIKKKTKKLLSYNEKVDKTNTIIDGMIGKIRDAKINVLERSKEQKEKPWIDAKFNNNISKLAKNEIRNLSDLSSSLRVYKSMVNSAYKERDPEKELDVLHELMVEEEKKIVENEKENEKEINKMEKETLAERLKKSSVKVPQRTTSDGVSWGNIAKVARQFGGWVVVLSDHQRGIDFPDAKRTIPLSGDVSATALAGQFKEQLKHSLPDNKIPNATNIRNALVSGDIHHSV